MSPETGAGRGGPDHDPAGAPPGVPTRALVLSLCTLAVPVVATALFPEFTGEDVGVLIWLSALVPAFLLTYYRGWTGASLALAGGMAALSVAQVALALTEQPSPPFAVLLGVVMVLLTVSLGTGAMGDLLHRARDEARRTALTDGLTGLPNRRHVTLFLESAFAAARRGVPLSVVVFDLDRFKSVNDDHGHAAGDEAIRTFARILGDRTRQMNLSGRFGGEEFLTVLNHADLSGGVAFAEAVCRAFGETEFPWGRVTVSAGVAEYERGMPSPDVLYAAADQALYRAKEAGRDRVVAVGPRGRVAAPGSEPTPEPAAPAAGAAGAASGRDLDEVPRGKGETILVVDDDHDARRSVTRALSRFDYHVLEADGPEAALRIFRGRDRPVDLVLSDVIMPRMSGFRLAEMLLDLQPGLRVLYMSGYSQDRVDWGGVPGYIRGFIGKPMAVDELAVAVREVLDAADPAPIEDLPGAGRSVAVPPPRGTAEGERDVGPRAPLAAASASRASRPRGSAAGASGAPDGEDGDEVGGPRRDATVMVVDDDPTQTDFLARGLRHMGWKDVRVVNDPHEALEGIREEEPDALLVDLRMPGMDGIELVEAVRSAVGEDAFLPLLVMTGDADGEARRRALDAGATDFLTKPLRLPEVDARIRTQMRVRRLNHRVQRHARELEARVAARTAELEEARTEMLLRLARAAEYRDDLTGVHAERVGVLSGMLADTLGLPRDQVDLIHRAAPLHDVGKVGIADAVLRKPGPLTDAEMAEMRRHTVIGAQILSGSRHPVLRTAETIALGHHERWNGEGYPKGLKGEETPVEARIVAVADVYDSLSHDRPYRPALHPTEVISYLTRRSGQLFDPAVVDALLELERGDRLREADELEIVARPDSLFTLARGA